VGDGQHATRTESSADSGQKDSRVSETDRAEHGEHGVDVLAALLEEPGRLGTVKDHAGVGPACVSGFDLGEGHADADRAGAQGGDVGEVATLAAVRLQGGSAGADTEHLGFGAWSGTRTLPGPKARQGA
jgi:hypothetical protein